MSSDDDVISVDFDGVLNSYKTKWNAAGDIPDEPVPGAIEWLHGILQRFNVVIHTVRANIRGADESIFEWLLKNGLPPADLDRITVSAEKPNAWIFLDDRAWRFEGPGSFPTVEQIEAFTPWNKRHGDARPEGPQGVVDQEKVDAFNDLEAQVASVLLGKSQL